MPAVIVAAPYKVTNGFPIIENMMIHTFIKMNNTGVTG